MERMKNVFIGIVIGLMLSSIPIFAQTASSISVKLNAINVQLEGEPVDVNSILYQGSTYLPMRKVAELVGKDVEWEGRTMTANITGNVATGSDGISSVNISETHISASDLADIISKTIKYDLFALHDADGNLFIRLVEYVDEREDKRGEYVTAIDSIPYVMDKGRAYVSKSYYERKIAPLIR